MSFDKDGYPSRDTLTEIREYNIIPDGLRGFLSLVFKHWRYPNLISFSEHDLDRCVLKMSTGGWSGNEVIMAEIECNDGFWDINWCQSRKGGHYWFTLPISEMVYWRDVCAGYYVDEIQRS